LSRGHKRGGGDVPPTPAAALVPAAAVPVMAIEIEPPEPGHGARAGGRRRVTPEGTALIESWAAAGATKTAIAAKLRIDRGTLARICERQPEVAQAIAAGGSAHETECVDTLTAIMRSGEDDHVRARCGMFLLKARHGWREGDARDGGSVTTNVQVINLPASMTPEQWVQSLQAKDGAS
jgi:hypothetical protein